MAKHIRLIVWNAKNYLTYCKALGLSFWQIFICDWCFVYIKDQHDNDVQRHLFIKRKITSNRSTIIKWFYVSKFFDLARCMTEEAEVRSGLKNKDRQNRTPDFGRPVLVRKGRGKKVMIWSRVFLLKIKT